MEKHVQAFLHKISYCFITIATITLLLIILQTPETCVDPYNPHTKFHHRFPKSTCDYKHRAYTSLEKRNKRLWATSAWSHAVQSYLNVFQELQSNNLLSNLSHSFVVSAGAGQAVMALKNMGVTEVIGVEIIDSPPLVSRADPHSLPFFDEVFDFGFSPFLDRALFPGRYVSELERTVNVGGVCLVAVEECGPQEVDEIVKLFKKSQYVEAKNETLAGEKMTRITLKVIKR
ncbi:hypothetical protein Leryth_003031 [Lithospermum erythrorhizon]|nr:hypothetical protein Leryth_003031 [Lithospermum erythrorhizon]